MERTKERRYRAHPIVARLWHRMSHQADPKGMREHRRETLEGLRGRVVEVGAGNGINFQYYPPTIAGVVAIEPEPYLRERAEDAAARASVPVHVIEGTAGRIPEPDASFDAGVVSLVLCIVRPQRALAELFRVIRPGGELRFYEHVRSTRPGFARFQRSFDIVWPRVNGWGCHASRDTPAAITAAGFMIEQMRRFSFRASPLEFPVSPHVIGRARRPA